MTGSSLHGAPRSSDRCLPGPRNEPEEYSEASAGACIHDYAQLQHAVAWGSKNANKFVLREPTTSSARHRVC
jgi:hypothetical protein